MTAVGRTLARALNVNEDLTECIALAHDIGHSPFGHAGEETLNELMRDHGGFDHNLQSVRWVEYLEQRYPEFDGLNLTWEVRAGLRKHLADQPGAQLDGWPIGPRQHLEAQIADIADDIAYHAHDVDDGLEAGLLTMDQLRELELWRRAERRVASSYTALASHHHRALTVRNLLDLQVEDILHHSAALLERVSPADPDEVMRCSERLVTFGDEMAEIQQTTRDFLFRHMYGHPEVAGANQESARLMVRLFQHYVSHPETLGGKARERLVQDGVWRTVCDYVSGMTDRYALKECAAYGLDGHAGQESDEP
jgi:dGTPase